MSLKKTIKGLHQQQKKITKKVVKVVAGTLGGPPGVKFSDIVGKPRSNVKTPRKIPRRINPWGSKPKKIKKISLSRKFKK